MKTGIWWSTLPVLALLLAPLALGATRARSANRAQEPEAPAIAAHADKSIPCEACHADKATASTYEHPFFAGNCTGTCHDADSKNAYRLTVPPEQLCRNCHVTLPNEPAFLHTAVSEGYCAGCHNPHGSERPKFLRADTDAEMCLSCHADLPDGGPDGHMPAENGMCGMCHGAHGGVAEPNLNLPQPQLCVVCHANMMELPAHPHSAIERVGCTGCHDPHWAPGPKQLREPVDGVICFRCHQNDADGRALVHQPVKDRLCTFCHGPHGSEREFNLLFDQPMVCTMCHADKAAPKTYMHPAVMMGCTLCHDPHASDHPGRLKLDVITTCTMCHAGYDDGRHAAAGLTRPGHPMGDVEHPYKPGRLLDCAGCHDPHGGENPRFFYFAQTKVELCGECHATAPSKPNPAFTEWLEALERERLAEPDPPAGSEEDRNDSSGGSE
jgi:predicted CXXCH cytochrome family protein